VAGHYKAIQLWVNLAQGVQDVHAGYQTIVNDQIPVVQLDGEPVRFV